MNKEKFSFSKLDTFNTCPRSYYLTYIKKVEREENVYGFLGSSFHDCLEKLQKKEITTEEAKDKFLNDISTTEIFEMKFPTEKSKKNYIECLMAYLDNYERLPIDNFETEEYFEFEIEGVIMRGYIDLYFIKDNNIYVLDYKTSSKFSKNDLEKKEKQLILYGIYLQEKYPNKNIVYLGFDMCKYFVNKRGTLKTRDTQEESYGNAYVEVKFTEEKKEELVDYIDSIVKHIDICDKEDIRCWSKNINKFFCDNLCSVKKYCN